MCKYSGVSLAWTVESHHNRRIALAVAGGPGPGKSDGRLVQGDRYDQHVQDTAGRGCMLYSYNEVTEISIGQGRDWV